MSNPSTPRAPWRARRAHAAGCHTAAAGIVLALAGGLAAPPAHALTACTAAQIVAQDPNCPNSSAPCTISKVFDVGDLCVLDFGSRAVTIAGSGELDIASGSVSLLAGSLVIAPGGFIDGRGNQSTAPRNAGGRIIIQTTGAVTLQKAGTSNGRIDVSANAQAGAVEILAGGTVSISGKVTATQLTTTGAGGTISVSAGADILAASGSVVSATGGTASTGGGEISMDAGGRLDLGSDLDVTGSEGGSIDLYSGADMVVRGLSAVGAGDAGSGGTVDLYAGTSLQVLGQILLKGTMSGTLSGGGSGGYVDIESEFGDVIVAGSITSTGADPDGDGGDIMITAAGAVTVQSGAVLSGRALGSLGVGGTISVDAQLDVSIAGRLDMSSAEEGGEVSLLGGRHVTVTAPIDASGRYYGAYGGAVMAEAGIMGTGDVSVQSAIDVSGGGCGTELGCGAGGSVDLSGCDATVAATGSLDARGADGGANTVTARERLTISGPINATTTGGGTDGSTTVTYPSRKPPVIGSGLISPPAVTTALDTCSAAGQASCLIPCPTCGNSVVEFPEGCDDGASSPASCDGCSAFCQLENCDDGLGCTIDSCDPRLGCRHVFTSGPCNPTATATSGPVGTPTPTHTRTATRTATHTFTPSATPTSTPTPTQTPTPTPTATPTSTRTPTVTPSSTATAPLVSPSPTEVPIAFHDSVVLPVRSLRAVIPAGVTSVAKRLRVRVRNADVRPTVETPGHRIQLSMTDGDCPPGTIASPPDFDSKTGGAQDSVIVPGGRTRTATVFLFIARDAFTTPNWAAPQRCTLLARVEALVPGNSDPTPTNDVFGIELNVTDQNDTGTAAVHESVIDSVRSIAVRIGRGKSAVTKSARFKVRNADAVDGSAGHAVTATASDGDCPAGTVGLVDLDAEAPGAQGVAPVKGRGARAGHVPLTITAAAFATGSGKAPARCRAVLSASGPSGDSDSTNNVSILVIDVIDRNDY